RAPARPARGVSGAAPRLLPAHPGRVVPRDADARVARRGLCAARARLAARPPSGRCGPPRGVTDAFTGAPWLAYGHPAWMIVSLALCGFALRIGLSLRRARR